MVNPSSPQHNKGSSADSATARAEAELLQAVLSSDVYAQDGSATDESDEDVAAGQVLEISDQEASEGWQKLSSQLNQLWSEEGEQAASFQSALLQKFSSRLPVELLTQLAEKAKQISENGEALAAQMVACVQEVVDGLADDDLRVMARPMAMAMRGRASDEIAESTVKSIREADWEALSSVEQAKLSLAAARYALIEARET